MGKVGDGRVCLLAWFFFCSRCTTAPAPELCRNPSTAPLPTSSATPRPRGSCPVGQESLSCGSNHGAVISVGKSLRKSSWYRRERTACSVPPRRTTPPSAQRGARAAAGSGGGCAASPRAGTAQLRGRDVRASSGLGRCLVKRGGFSSSPRSAVHDVFFHVPWRRALGEHR